MQMSSTATSIIQLLHSEDADPNALFYHNALSISELKSAATFLVPFLKGRSDALNGYIAASDSAHISASSKTKSLWREKKEDVESLLAVYGNAEKDESALSQEENNTRTVFLKTCSELWHVKLKKALVALDKEIVGPFALGES